MEMNEGLRYKLRMMGIPAAGPPSALRGSKAAAGSSALPEPQLKKKHLGMRCHYVRESCAKLAARVAFEGSHSSLAGMRAKVLGKAKRKELRKGLLCWCSSGYAKESCCSMGSEPKYLIRPLAFLHISWL